MPREPKVSQIATGAFFEVGPTVIPPSCGTEGCAPDAARAQGALRAAALDAR